MTASPLHTVLLIDPSGEIRWADPTAPGFFDVPSANLAAGNISKILGEEALQRVLGDVSSSKPLETELRVRRSGDNESPSVEKVGVEWQTLGDSGLIAVTIRLPCPAPCFRESDLNSPVMQRVLDSLPFAVFFKDRDLVYRGCNGAFESILRLGRKELIGRTLPDIVPAELAQVYQTADLALLENPEPQVYRAPVETADKGRRIFEFHKTVYDTDGNGTPGIIGAMLDVTERAQNEKLISSVIDHSPVPTVVVDRHGKLSHYNPALEKLTGYSSLEVDTIESLTRRLHPDPEEFARVQEAIRVLHEDGYMPQTRWRMRRADGSYRTIELKISKWEEGHVAQLIDISDQVAAEDSLLRSQMRLEGILDGIPDLVMQVDGDCRILWANKAAREGNPDIVGRRCHDVFFGLDSPCPNCPMREAMEQGRVKRTIATYRDPAGTGVVHWEHSALPLEVSDSAEKQVVVVLRDITKRKAHEIEIRRYADIVSNMNLGLLVWDLEGIERPADMRLIGANAATERLLGVTADNMIGRTMAEIFPGLLETEIPGRWLDISKSGQPYALEDFPYSDSRLKRRIYSVKAFALPHSCVGVLFEDVTRRKRMEMRERRARDEAERANLAKSEFLANMSHELRTPMHSILSYSRFGLKKADSADRARLLDYFQQINVSGNRLLKLLNSLLDLSKLESGKMDYHFERVDMMHLVDAAISEFASTLKEKGLTLEVKAPDVETIIYGDMLRLGQVLRNLLSNAIKFSGQGKVITIDFGRSIVSVSGREVPALKIRVTDQGTGIPAAERELIFDKFVQGTSTHDGAGGTGLGLAISLEIVRAHHGRIWANANPDGPGTRLVVVLPIDPPEPQPTASSPEENGREQDASLTNHDRG